LIKEMNMSRYLVREKDVQGYSPANHHGTVNKRLVSQTNVGAQHMEVVLGTLEKGGGALPRYGASVLFAGRHGRG
jgi:hypothetical protein